MIIDRQSRAFRIVFALLTKKRPSEVVRIESISELGSRALREEAARQRRCDFLGDLFILALVFLIGWSEYINEHLLATLAFFGAFFLLTLIVRYLFNKDEHATYLENSKKLGSVSENEYKCIKSVMHKYPELREARVRMGCDYILRVEADFVAEYDRKREGHLDGIRMKMAKKD